MHKFITLLVLAGLCFLVGCQPMGIAAEKIHGRWVIIGADRGNGSTEAMNGMYFTFEADNNMATNFTEMGEEAIYAYELGTTEMGPLTQKSPEPLTYNITAMADSAMTMTTTWRGTDFTFELRKRALQNEAPQQPDAPTPAEPDTAAAIIPSEPQ